MIELRLPDCETCVCYKCNKEGDPWCWCVEKDPKRDVKVMDCDNYRHVDQVVSWLPDAKELGVVG